jgi:hypothetical protein
MQECWSTDNQKERLTPPRLDHEVGMLQQVISLIKNAGHQVYVSLYAGIPHLKAVPCDDQQLKNFEEGVLQCLNSGGTEALVDNGVGFWTEHHRLWGEAEWFRITSEKNERALSQVLDRYIMRQKTMLSLTVHKEFSSDFVDNYSILATTALRLMTNQWPPEEVEPQDIEDEEYEEEPAGPEEPKTIDDELYKESARRIR